MGWERREDAEAFDVFLSYTHADTPAVEALHAALEAVGLRVFRDAEQIATFESISRRLEQGLARSKVLLAHYSERYPTRRPCQWELTNAFIAAEALGEANDRILVVNPIASVDHIAPVRLRDQLLPSVDDLDELARAVASHVASIEGPLGRQVVAAPPMHGRVLLGSDRFTDRYATLWAIYEALHGDDVPIVAGRVASRPAVLCGQGGQGKSLVAEEYALRFGGLYPGGVLWLRALGDQLGGGPSASASDVAVRAAAYGALAGEVLADELVRAVSADDLRAELLAEIGRRGPSLWIIDDLAVGLDDEAFRAWLPVADQAHVLVTTRGRYGQGARIDLDVLGGPDAVALLTAQVAPVDDAEADAAAEVARLLGGHALALDVAGSAVRYEGSAPYDAFHRRLLDPAEAVAVLDQVGIELPNGHEPSIVATIGGAIGRVHEDGAIVLELASALAADVPIPVELLRVDDPAVWAGGSGSDARRRAQAGLVEAERHGLIARTEDGAWRLHRLVGQVVAHRSDPQRRAQVRGALRAQLLRVLRSPDDLATRTEDAGLIDHGRALLAHLDEPSAGPLAVWFAGYEIRWGEVAQGVALAEHGLTAATLADDGTAPATRALAEAAATATHALRLGGRSGEACRQAEALVGRISAVLGPDDLATLRLQHQLAAALATERRFAEARAVQLDVHERFRRVLGDDDPETLWAMSNHAIDLSDAGDLHGAARVAEQVLVDRVRILGPEHPATLMSMANLASDWAALGRFAAAYELAEKVVVARERILGVDHLDTLQARANLADRLLDVGDVRGALALREAVAEARLRHLGPDHPLTLEMQWLTAWCLEELGDPERADAIEDEVLRRHLDQRGPDHPETIRARARLAARLRRRGRIEEGRRLEEEVVADWVRTVGPEHPDALDARMNLAVSQQADGELDVAVAAYRAVHETRLRTSGPDHPDTLWVASNLAAALLDLGELDAAEALARATLASRQRLIGAEHLETLRTAYLLADLRARQGDLAEAAELGLAVVAGRAARLGPAHPDTVLARSTTAGWLQSVDRSEDARRLREEQVALLIDRDGPEAPSVTEALVDASSVLVDEADLRRALARAREAFDRRAAAPADGAQHALGTWIGVLLHLSGDLAGAQAQLAAHLAPLERERGVDDRIAVLGRSLLASLADAPPEVPEPEPPEVPEAAAPEPEAAEAPVAPAAPDPALPPPAPPETAVGGSRADAVLAAAADAGAGPLGDRVLEADRARAAGSTAAARAQVDAVVREAAKALGKRHPLTLEARFVAALVRLDEGRPASARAELKGLARDAAKALGDHAELVGAVRWRQAELEAGDGHLALAVATGERAVEALAAAHGAADDRVVRARAALEGWRQRRAAR